MTGDIDFDPADEVTRMQGVVQDLGEGEVVDVDTNPDADYDDYVSVPVGHNHAVEIEFDGETWYVTERRWDRTGGLSADVEIGAYTYYSQMIKAARDRIELIKFQYDRTEVLLAESTSEEN